VVFFRVGQGSRLAAATLPFVVRTPLAFMTPVRADIEFDRYWMPTAFVMPMLVSVLAGIERQRY
jgi:hypothetical protein